MPACVPLEDMRDTARFSELVENTPGPVTVTKNGYGKFVVMRVEDYDELEERAAKADLLSRMAIAERERAEKDYVDAFDALDRLEEKHGL